MTDRVHAAVRRLLTSRATGWVGVGAALVLALRPPFLVARGERLPDDDISGFEADFARLERTVPREARIAWLLPGDAPGLVGKLIVVSRYALAPRRVTSIDVRVCDARGPDACGARAVDLLVVPTWPRYSSADAARKLGFEFADRGPGLALATRRR